MTRRKRSGAQVAALCCVGGTWGGDVAEGGGDEDEWRCARVAENHGFTGVTSVSGNCLFVGGGGGA